jgi:hypothetical protein
MAGKTPKIGALVGENHPGCSIFMFDCPFQMCSNAVWKRRTRPIKMIMEEATFCWFLFFVVLISEIGGVSCVKSNKSSVFSCYYIVCPKKTMFWSCIMILPGRRVPKGLHVALSLLETTCHEVMAKTSWFPTISELLKLGFTHAIE